MKTKKKKLKIFAIVLLRLAVVGTGTGFGVNAYVKGVGNDTILTSKRAAELEDVDCVIVLGCQVRDDGSLSDMLRDRLWRGLELYENGVPSENIFMDPVKFMWDMISRVGTDFACTVTPWNELPAELPE